MRASLVIRNTPSAEPRGTQRERQRVRDPRHGQNQLHAEGPEETLEQEGHRDLTATRPDTVARPEAVRVVSRTPARARTTSGGAPGIRQISPYRCVIARTKSQALPALRKADRAAGSEGPRMPLGAARVVADTGGIVHSARSEAGLGTALRSPAP
jgi:hypothetical protein